jgi:alkylation response protein AidB-like acyl-CoA dehydrogenase
MTGADELIGWLRSYAETRLSSRLMDERRTITPAVVLDFGNAGLMGLQVPPAHGGLGLGNVDFLRVCEQLSAIDLTLALFVGNHNALGLRPIQRSARPALRDELLPALAQGRKLAAFALTEPGAGSDPKAMAATATADGAGGWRLRGHKVWSGSASWSGVVCTFAKLVNERGRPAGITGFAVTQGTPGLRNGTEALTMGMRGMVQSAVHFDDVRVGEEQLLGEPGRGFEVAAEAMQHARLAIGASCVGAMKRCLQLAGRYALRRSIGTGRLVDNPVTQIRLGEMSTALRAFEAYVYRIAVLAERGPVPAEAYAVCKSRGPELLWSAVDVLIQMLGGRGYLEPNVAPQLMRDARVLRIFEGPTETMTMFAGSGLLHNPAALVRFVEHDLESPALAGRLTALAAEIAERHGKPGTSFDAAEPALYWACQLAGEAVGAVLLLATAPPLARPWAEARLDGVCRGIASPRPPWACPRESLPERLAELATSIGDVEQQLAGEDGALDPLLRREGHASD